MSIEEPPVDLDLTNPRQFRQAQDLYDRLRALYDSDDIREGELQTLQDLHTQMMPMWEEEAARDAQRAELERGYQFGDVGDKAGDDTLAAAMSTFANAGDVTRRMLPESVQDYVHPAVSYLPDMALGGLLGAFGGLQKAVGYGSEVADLGARNLVEGLGGDYRFAPGTGAEKLYKDLMGGLEVAGVGPEIRALGAVSQAARPMLSRQGLLDATEGVRDFAIDDFGGLRLYRGTNDSGERITGGIGEGLLFGTPHEDVARLYGDNVTSFELPDGAKILTEGTKEFADITGRKRGPLLRTMQPGENLVSAANEAIERARAAGYDAVDFNSTRDMGVAIINRDVVRPIPSAPTDPAAARGQEIMGLLTSGRSADVTDEMLDLGDPVQNARLNEHLFNNYDLPMDAASRAERARGFKGGLYSGTGDDFTAFRDQSWATDNPDLAYTYAPSEGGSIMPLAMRAKHGAPVINAGGANWNALTPSMREGGPDAPYIAGLMTDPEEIAKYGEDLLSTQNIADAARMQGSSGVTFNDLVDVGGYFSKYAPEGPMRDAQKASIARASGPSTVEMRHYPNQVRSAFARFDPRLSHLRNLNAALAAGAPLGLLALQDEEQY
jgi:hypothetical protein